MRRYLFVLFAFITLPLYSQKFRLNAEAAFSHFSNINDRQVSFYGFGLNYSYYIYKKLGLVIGFDHYLPATYYGLVPIVSYRVDEKIPVIITGGANAITFGFRMKVIDPDSKRMEVNTTIAISSFNHKGSYHIEETLINGVRNRVNSIYAGVELILKKGNFPLAISGGYNFVRGQKEYVVNYYDAFSVPFSSSFLIKARISLPVMKGPSPSQIRQIEY